MLNAAFWSLAVVVFTTTLLPLTNSVQWWKRMWDFPRLHIAIVALVLIAVALPFAISFKPVLLGLLAAAFFYQAVQIFRYTPLALTEVDMVSAPSQAHEIHFLAVNVLMENTRYDDLIRIIAREDPDVLLLMETDAAWAEALEDVLVRYVTVKSHIADDHYGLIFATKLDVVTVDFLWPSDDDTPSVKAILRAPSGPEFNFIGLHPRPPVPGNDTETRDRQIKEAALMTSSADRPTICMGDFNDVAWSWTTKRFKRYGDFREPRVGRGMISSFHADYPFMRLPIDQLFITENVGLVSFDRLENFGSEHFPIAATVFFADSEGPEDG
ncbi:endonuclease/exonuclease/phosphatase family protein [Sedimentitalea todarodis]|uniref:Endonuclease/exonuclease/phosphatase family protein n=1 Tax=Sedimentitalea todarodis TaxID=1631240 RepID=A0ABU3VL79_9RHOB|nr:endonuclease/exonuclease/phosphatase family protein [Sedimentitalea todarodis]MDU9006951.1 endonuclease/exonuclease/phosphatase family protein [Sedimentitalea todarodis]